MSYMRWDTDKDLMWYIYGDTDDKLVINPSQVASHVGYTVEQVTNLRDVLTEYLEEIAEERAMEATNVTDR